MRRFLAFALDLLAVNAVAYAAVAALGSHWGAGPWAYAASYSWNFWVFMPIFVAWFGIFEGCCGCTPGKWLCGLRVEPGRACIARALHTGVTLEALPLLASLLLLAKADPNASWSDLLAASPLLWALPSLAILAGWVMTVKATGIRDRMFGCVWRVSHARRCQSHP